LRLLLFCAAFLIAWGPSLFGPFHFDDHSMLRDPLVTSPGGWREVFRPLQTRPLTEFTFWVSYQLGGGASPAGFHAWNLALHALNSLLVWQVLKRMPLLPQAGVFAAVAVFALHPLQSEPVNYLFARSTLLMSAFCLGTLLAWLEERYALAGVLFGFALLAKEECVTFPVFLLLLDWWRSGLARPSKRAWVTAGVMLGLAVAAGLRAIAATAAIAGSGAGVTAGVTPWDYFRTQGTVILERYVRMLVLPAGLTVDATVDTPSWFWGIAAWVVLVAGCAVMVRREKTTGWWFAAGLILLLPSSSIFPAEDLAADRRMYLPMFAFACVFARMPAGIAPVLILVLSGWSCVRTTQVWNSEAALWREAVELSPRKVRPKIQLARVSRIDEARRLLEDAARLEPANPDIPNELGVLLLRAKRAPEALAAFGKALALAPGDAKTTNNRGVALQQLGQNDAARQDFLRALAIDPCLMDARRNLEVLGGEAPVCTPPR